MQRWFFEADYFTACNCDWGCPCNVNARPTEGRCMGWGAWSISSGQFDNTVLDASRFAVYYRFPGRVEDGQGTACVYIDSRTSAEQQQALEQIARGKAGGGIFELFGQALVSEWLPTKIAPIEFDVTESGGCVVIEQFGEASCELLAYPDGTIIRPVQELPHGIEYKRALMTNARRWWWRDDSLLATYENKYGAVAKVRFTQEGCMA